LYWPSSIFLLAFIYFHWPSCFLYNSLLIVFLFFLFLTLAFMESFQKFKTYSLVSFILRASQSVYQFVNRPAIFLLGTPFLTVGHKYSSLAHHRFALDIPPWHNIFWPSIFLLGTTFLPIASP
jgi:signal transduction histidine kinase